MCVILLSDYVLCSRGKQTFDQSGVGAAKPAEVKKEDDEFELYRKRMMLAYRFRPNPLVCYVLQAKQDPNEIYTILVSSFYFYIYIF